MANLAIAAIMVHDSRTLGRWLGITIKATATNETSTANSGFSEKYVSINLNFVPYLARLQKRRYWLQNVIYYHRVNETQNNNANSQN